MSGEIFDVNFRNQKCMLRAKRNTERLKNENKKQK